MKAYVALAALLLSGGLAGCSLPMGENAPAAGPTPTDPSAPDWWEPQYLATYDGQYSTEKATGTLQQLGFDLMESQSDHVAGRRSDGEQLEIRTLSGVPGAATLMRAPRVPRDANTPDGPTACERATPEFEALMRGVLGATGWSARRAGPCEVTHIAS